MIDRSDGSGAGWSDVERRVEGRAVVTADGHPFRIEAGGRYQEIDVVGRGGMGHVVVARDRRLGRDVALKRIAAAADAPAQAARLAREARVTAILEHPSIVPVYDAGVGDDGRLFYTMRLIHGRSLAAAARECRGPGERLRLLRPFLAVCEAVAYAHSMGVVHRDLKPANVMVGGFGETQVVDWGLAAFTAAAPLALRSEPGVQVGDTDAAVGTPGYMSPEQARGEAADPRADVWSLGVIASELVAGLPAPPLAPSVPTRVLALAPPPPVPSVAPPPPVPSVPSVPSVPDLPALAAPLQPAPPLPAPIYRRPGAGPAADSRPSAPRLFALPPELAAIVAKATAADPAARYADAGEMAAEVARFLDGRRVVAHAYTTLELGRRLVRRLRLPIALLATAVLVTAVAVAVSFRRISRERTRARAAETSVRAALEDGRRTTAWALTRQAIAELERGAVAEAGVLAAHALALDESADARGVVAAALVSPSPRHADTMVLPGCARVVPGTWDLALCHDSDHVELWQLDPPVRRWRRALGAHLVALAAPANGPARVVVVADDAALVVLRAADGSVEARHPLAIATGFADAMQVSLDGEHVAVSDGRIVNLIDLGGRSPRFHDRLCDGKPALMALGAGTARFAIVCADGATHVVDAVTHTRRAGPIVPGAPGLQPRAAALSADGRGLVIGGLDGAVIAIDLVAGTVGAPIAIRGGAVTQLAYLPGPGARVLAGADRVGATVVDVASGAVVLRLPASASQSFRVTAGGIVTGGRQAGRWQLDPALRPRVLVAPAGLSAVAATDDRRWIAASRGDGRVSIWDGTTGALATELTVGHGVVKAVAFSPDGGRLAISTGGATGGPRVVAVGTWTPLALDDGAAPATRRLAYTADGRLVAAHYAPPPSLWSATGARRPLTGPEVYDLATSPDRQVAVLLAVDGDVWALDGDHLCLVAQASGAAAVATWAHGTAVATSHVTSILLHAGDTAPRRLDTDSRVLDLAIAPDERYLAAARTDGTTAVWRLADLHLVAILRGHTQRAVQVAISPDRIALTASWDGTVLAWDLAALDTTPAALIATLEARWGIDLPRTLQPTAISE